MLLRMRDVVFALSAAKKYDYALSKIQLQKFIYLLDITSFFYKYLPPLKAYDTYKRGPYDVDIQNAADSLVFRGLVAATKVIVLSDKSKQAQYELTDAGQSWVLDLIDVEDFKIRNEAADSVATQLDRIGWNRLVKLVYSEPTFIARRPHGLGQAIDITDGLDSSAAFLVELMLKSIRRGDSTINVSRENINTLFFRYLDVYSRRVIPANKYESEVENES